MAIANAPAVPPRMVAVKKQRDLAPAIDKAADATGAHGFVSDSANALRAASGLARTNRVVDAAAKLTMGDAQAIAAIEAGLLARIGGLAERLGPRAQALALRTSGPFVRGTSKAVKAMGKAAPALGVLSSAYDVRKAVKEPDAAKQGAAWTNAGLSVAATGLGFWGMAQGFTRRGAIGLAAASGIGFFQLADAYLFKGQGTAWLAEHVGEPAAEGVKQGLSDR